MNTHQNKIALVTGATRGIGAETVRQLAGAGVHTLLAGRSRGTAVERALKLQAEGLPVEALQLDVTDAASIAAAVREVEQRHGRLDILVNNAGIFRDDLAATPSAQSLETWRETFDTNLFGVVATTRAFLPLLRRSAAGRIVNLSSALASLSLHSDPGFEFHDFKFPAYDASKSVANATDAALANDNDGKVQSILRRAMTLLGTPYRWGGTSPDAGFDCSGLVGYVFRTALGVELPRVSREMASQASNELIKDRSALVAGDLVFFGRKGRVDHVGIYVGDGRFLHAPSSGKDVRVDTLLSGYWGNKFMQARRVDL